MAFGLGQVRNVRRGLSVLLGHLQRSSSAPSNPRRLLHSSPSLLGSHSVTMPSLSPTMTEGTIVRWLKKEGDPIAPGDALCEIQTDKAVMTLEWDDEAILAKIISPDNSVDIRVGSLIAVTVDEGDDWKSVEVPSEGGAAAAPPLAAAAVAAEGGSGDISPVGVNRVNMPSLSPTMQEGTIVQWLKREGDSITAGDLLCEIQTDKAVVSMEWDEDCVLAKILMPAGSGEVKVGSLIALTADEGVDWKTVQIPLSPAAPSSAPPPKAPKPQAPAPIPSIAPSSEERVRLLGPAVQHHLKAYGLRSSQLKGSGPHGTITKADVLQFVLANKLQPQSQEVGGKSAPASSKTPPKKGKKGSPASFVELEVSNMRRTIAKRLLQSKSTIPHSYGSAECNVHNLNAFRKKLGGEGIKVSVNDIIIKCVSNALIRVPSVNCVWEGDKLSEKRSVDISVAVATPNGLITPIVFNSGDRDVIQIGDVVKGLAAKAKDGKLQPQEFMGGSFSVSNLGMFGVHSFSAIINPPQCAILAVGGNSISIDERGRALTTTKVTLSFDATAIANDEASKFLAVLKNEIETTNEISMGIYDIPARKERINLEA